MKLKLVTLCFLCLAFLATEALAQKNIRMFLDYARFRYDETDTYLEIYYMLYDVSQDSVKQKKDVWLEFQLAEIEKDSLLATSKLKVTFDPGTANGTLSSDAKGSLIKTVLPQGRYRIKMIRFREDGSTVDSIQQEFNTGPFGGDKITMSDVELCSNIRTNPTSDKGLFYKNTMEVIPNPMRSFGKETPRLYFYNELYNVNSDNAEDKVRIEVAIADVNGKIRDQKVYHRQRQHESLVEIGAFDVAGLENGLYTLVFAVTDSVGDYAVYKRNQFYILNSNEDLADDANMMSLFAESDYFKLSESEVDEHFEMARYVATPQEVLIFGTLQDVDSKRVFMFKFWYEREHTGNGIADEYYERVAYATKNYRYYNLPGWKSDRGRVYILYGEPSQINRNANNPDRRPYVIWWYHELEGGAKFLFLDESGFGDYKLLSSTLRGEIYNPEYDAQLFEN